VINMRIFKSILTIFIFLGLISGINVQSAYFELPGSQSPLSSRCNSFLNLYIVPENGEIINTAEAIIKYDSSNIDIFDTNPDNSGFQLESGDAFESYFGTINSSQSEIRFVGFSLNKFVTERKLFARIRFRPKNKTLEKTDFKLVFDKIGNTYDSNIVESKSSKDVLTKGFETEVRFTDQNCDFDTLAPTVVFKKPINFETLTSDANEIELEILDSGSGVDLSSLNIYIGNKVYTVNSPELSFEKIPGGYKIIIKPAKPIPRALATQIIVKVSDIEGNLETKAANFNVPKDLQEEVCRADGKDKLTENIFIEDPKVILDPENIFNSNLPEILQDKSERIFAGNNQVFFGGTLRQEAIDRLLSLANLQWILFGCLVLWLLGAGFLVFSFFAYKINNQTIPREIDPEIFFNKKLILNLLIDQKEQKLLRLADFQTNADGQFEFKLPLNRFFRIEILDLDNLDSRKTVNRQTFLDISAYSSNLKRRIYGFCLNIIPGFLVFGFLLNILCYYFWDNNFLVFLMFMYLALFIALAYRFRKFIFN